MTDTTRTLTKIDTTADELGIADGDQIRLEMSNGTVIEGIARVPFGLHSRQTFTINGLTVGRRDGDFYRVDGEVQHITPQKRTVDAGAVLEAIKAITSEPRPAKRAMPVASWEGLLVRLFGKDMYQTFSMSRLSRDSLYGQYLNITSIKRAIAALIESGDIVSLKPGTSYQHNPEDRHLDWYNVRVGWITAADKVELDRRVREARDEKRTAELRKQAIATIVARHQDEVDAELARLLAE